MLILIAFIILGLGGGLGALLALRITRMKSAALLALIAAVSFDLLAWRMPFFPLSIEAVVALTGLISTGFIFAFFFRIQKYFDPRTGVNPRPRPIVACGLMCVMIMLTASVMMPLVERQRFAWDLRWSFEGRIVDKYRSYNHGAPTLLVQKKDGAQKEIEGVRLAFWEQAQVNDHVQKQSGRTDALLNDRPVEMVRPFFKNAEGD